MPYKDKEINKLYFSIGEVAKILELNASLIRFWEKYFELSPPKKSRKGNRLFTKSEIEHLKEIRHLVKEKGYTLSGAKDQIKKTRTLENSENSLLLTLKELRSFLIEISNNI